MFQVRGCDVQSEPGAGDVQSEPYDGFAWVMVAGTVYEFVAAWCHGLVVMLFMVFNYAVYACGLAILVTAMAFLILGPITWGNSRWIRWFAQ